MGKPILRVRSTAWPDSEEFREREAQRLAHKQGEILLKAGGRRHNENTRTHTDAHRLTRTHTDARCIRRTHGCTRTRSLISSICARSSFSPEPESKKNNDFKKRGAGGRGGGGAAGGDGLCARATVRDGSLHSTSTTSFASLPITRTCPLSIPSLSPPFVDHERASKSKSLKKKLTPSPLAPSTCPSPPPRSSNARGASVRWSA